MSIPDCIERFLLKEEIKNSCIRSIKISEHYRYFGGLNEEGECENLGFIINVSSAKIYSCGHYKNGNLFGLGRTYQGEITYDGVFQYG